MSEFRKSTAICCTQPPVITENMENVRHGLDILLQDISTLPKSDDSLKYVKQIRANLAKEYERLETERKAAKKKILEPYEEAEKKYKAFISEPYKAADSLLKGWIDGYQDSLKNTCEATLRTYFEELCRVYGIDFIPFHRCGLVVDMALARQKEPRKAMERIEKFILAVRSDMDSILKMPDAEEIMAEYREYPVLSAAITTVARRKQQKESMRIYLEEQKRQRELAEENIAELMEAAPDLPKPEPKVSVSFRATGTLEALKTMKTYALSIGIIFEEITEEENKNDE